mmetsp:Transcript_12143/g.21343  ORF Transcript_12143/g.21343 Transcript_12143/m.21343 type:complete len:489 (-) Transcript_12143:225-1691(-)
MDLSYFMCSVASTFDNTTIETEEEQVFKTSASNSSSRRPPELWESSCSELSSHATESSDAATVPPSIHPPLQVKPGETSPSSLLLNRRFSTGLATSKKKAKQHPVLEGRPVIVQHNLSSLSGGSVTSISTKSNNNNRKTEDKNMAAVACAPPQAPSKSPQSGSQGTGDELVDTNLDGKVPSAVVALPCKHSNHEHGEEQEEDVDPQVVSSSSSSTSPLSRRVLRRSQTEPADRLQLFRFEPPPLRVEAWSEPSAETFLIRGKDYMKDRVKVASLLAAFRLFAVDLVNTERPIHSAMCEHPEERIQRALARERETGTKELPEFVFAVNLCVPGSINYHNVYYFGADRSCMEEIRNRTTPFGRLMSKFLYEDSNDFRNKTFKLIPRIVEGNYIVRKAVGSKPTILGRKIKQHYFRSERYMEVVVDIASDPIAQRVTKLCMGYLQTMVVDMMFLLEGTDETELPERVFGGARLSHVNFAELDGKRTVPLFD